MKLVVFALLVGAIMAAEPDTAATEQPPLAHTDHAVPTEPVQLDPMLDKYWDMYKKKFHKKYQSEEEEMKRRGYWEKAMKDINIHNLEAALGVYTYTLAINFLSDLPNDERLSMVGPLKLPAGFTMTPTALGAPKEELPESVDWRTSGYVTSVKDQGACGSCWAFSAAAALEGLLAKTTGSPPVSLSTQNLMDCSWKYGNMGCGGGWPHEAFHYVIENKGIDSWASYGYEMQSDQECHYNESTKAANCSEYHFVEADEESLKQAVATIGPISVALDASDLSYYSSGVYENMFCGKTLNHAVLLVGYGTDDDGQDYWLIKNSWGKGWGEKGYFKLARNKGQMCGISQYSVYPLNTAQ